MARPRRRSVLNIRDEDGNRIGQQIVGGEPTADDDEFMNRLYPTDTTTGEQDVQGAEESEKGSESAEESESGKSEGSDDEERTTEQIAETSPSGERPSSQEDNNEHRDAITTDHGINNNPGMDNPTTPITTDHAMFCQQSSGHEGTGENDDDDDDRKPPAVDHNNPILGEDEVLVGTGNESFTIGSTIDSGNKHTLPLPKGKQPQTSPMDSDEYLEYTKPNNTTSIPKHIFALNAKFLERNTKHLVNFARVRICDLSNELCGKTGYIQNTGNDDDKNPEENREYNISLDNGKSTKILGSRLYCLSRGMNDTLVSTHIHNFSCLEGRYSDMVTATNKRFNEIYHSKKLTYWSKGPTLSIWFPGSVTHLAW